MRRADMDAGTAYRRGAGGGGGGEGPGGGAAARVGAANPRNFHGDPAFGWGFYGHRTNLYRDTRPHEGFRILARWIERFGLAHFVVTSNVDGQFQKAGFREEEILEVHGSIHHLQ